mmetsp:Transcript_14385/g.39617  ORF Transcript_14385/g.39617 Transcript_14385/m.39617 type:complete len:320 (-) Transcript_14385:76-1035(-)
MWRTTSAIRQSLCISFSPASAYPSMACSTSSSSCRRGISSGEMRCLMNRRPTSCDVPCRTRSCQSASQGFISTLVLLERAASYHRMARYLRTPCRASRPPARGMETAMSSVSRTTNTRIGCIAAASAWAHPLCSMRTTSMMIPRCWILRMLNPISGGTTTTVVTMTRMTDAMMLKPVPKLRMPWRGDKPLHRPTRNPRLPRCRDTSVTIDPCRCFERSIFVHSGNMHDATRSESWFGLLHTAPRDCHNTRHRHVHFPSISLHAPCMEVHGIPPPCLHLHQFNTSTMDVGSVSAFTGKAGTVCRVKKRPAMVSVLTIILM